MGEDANYPDQGRAFSPANMPSGSVAMALPCSHDARVPRPCSSGSWHTLPMPTSDYWSLPAAFSRPSPRFAGESERGETRGHMVRLMCQQEDAEPKIETRFLARASTTTVGGEASPSR